MKCKDSNFWIGLGIGSVAGALAYHFSRTEKAKKLEDAICRAIHKVNPEKRNVPLYKNDAFQKVQKRRVQKSGEPGPSLHDQSPPLFSHLNTI